jgi:hypothetical protein
MSRAVIIASNGQLTWTMIFLILGALAVIVFVLWAVGAVVVHYFPSAGKTRSAGGNALLRLDTFFRPSTQHVIDAKEREEQQDEESGDPPDTQVR